jgi:hydroxymethylglutaryl-CoA synthase
MARAIVAGALYRPSYRSGRLWAPAADEDAFTFAVAAAERLLGRGERSPLPIDGLHLVGDFPAETDTGLPEALGVPHVAVQRHGRGLAALGSALRAAAGVETEGSALVIAADSVAEGGATGLSRGAGAVAYELRRGEGLLPTGAGARRHPNHRPPDADAWVLDAVRHSGLPTTGASGSLFFVAAESPPVLLAFWRRAQSGMAVVPASPSPAGAGTSHSLGAALWLLDIASRPDLGEWNLVARVTPEESQFVGLRRTGSFAVVGARPSSDEGPGLGAPPPAIPEEVRASVSEGAYVPRPRYLENLPSRWRLVAERCAACDTLTFPVRGRCRGCGRTEGLTDEPLPGVGTVLASTVVAPGAHPTEFDALVAAAGAYGVVLAEMAPKVRVTLQVADHTPEPVRPGRRITTQLRRLYPMEGEWRYGRKAIEEPDGA